MSPRHGRRLDVVLAYNATAGIQRGLRTDSLPDIDDAAMESAVAGLSAQGHSVRTLPVCYDSLAELEGIDAEFVFNMCEGSGVDGHPGVEVVDTLERRAIPYSGADSAFYHLTTGKFRTKQRLAAARVPVPLGAVMPTAEVPLPSPLRYPLFVKPRDAYGSLGVTDRSLVHDDDELRERVAAIVEECNTHALVEQYIDGREISVGLIGPSRRPLMLPPLEIRFGRAYEGRLPIRSFETKHDTSSPLYHDFEIACPAPLTPQVERRVRAVALRAYRALGGNGYGRVDIRLSKDGTPYVLEVNANCSLEQGPDDSDCGLMVLMGRAMGWSYGELLQHILVAGFSPRPIGRVPVAPRWRGGEMQLTSLVERAAGEALVPFGPVYPVPVVADGQRAMALSDGRRVLVEPHVTYLEDSRTPSLIARDDQGTMQLVATRAIARGEVLSLDFDVPLDASVAAARACGSRPRRARSSIHP
jgi:D-alanine-D-alanine ligase